MFFFIYHSFSETLREKWHLEIMKLGQKKVLKITMRTECRLCLTFQSKIVFNTFILRLPVSVKRRVNALKNILLESKKVESEFYHEIFELEKKFRERFVPLLEKVNVIYINLKLNLAQRHYFWCC